MLVNIIFHSLIEALSYFRNLEPCIIKTFGKPVVNKALKNHVNETPRATSAELCELLCFMEG